ncbi:hypothetical protein HOP50_18g82380 [Chloropicon primus]|uniref:PH domain-containing protein n=1 Tax=Chloropicon primus TaxID=1764295 RepID=A0A5B8MYP5_9CHLO|nr:hypothetical protein A3770_18p82150 [Chloropicon primus]UPR04893.1 hypothetical protein HOP50_18g82380 [Chloropicon primus]|eukprot:QDZ25697.1 hypothetical protein A3770_18p82150 [Chloropicon primus]
MMQQQPPSSSNGPPLPVNISYVVVFFLERDKWKQRILFVDWEKFSIRFLKWDSGKEQYSKFEIPVFELYSVVAGVDREILIYTTNGSVHPLRSKYEHEHGFLFKQLKDLNDFRNESASGALHWGAIQQRWMRMQRELTCNARQAGLVKRAFLTGDQKKKGRSNAWVVIARNRVLFYKAKKAGFPSHVVTLDEKFRLTGSQEDSEVVASSDYGSIPSEFVNHRANQEEHEEMAAETCQFSMKCYDYSHYMSWVQALVTTMKGSSEEGEENKASEERRPVEPAPKRGADTPASAASNQQGSAAAHAQPGEAKARPPAKIPSAAGSTPTTSRQMVSRQQASPAPVPSPRIPNFQAVAPTPPPPAYSNAGYSLMPTQQSALEPRRLAQTFETPGSSALSTSYPAMPTYSSLTPNLSPIKKRAVPASPPLPPLALLRKLKGNKAGRIYETSCTIGVQTDLQDPGPMLVEEPETPRSEEKIEDFLRKKSIFIFLECDKGERSGDATCNRRTRTKSTPGCKEFN